mmetsp:Transcript_7624/g.16395  ORF Transcript_7624/g.16395 Transcript_7624/m.16395 type:complete len:215 (+) Transcript_7624:56-700(+)|eukprot:CAMPEP_0204274672 /NCGR_PEP_ID=MMETSP0468-20130131/25322_1 /ASSEMBLY_ACC=CAM_ASM_000383 /TAXON_ID=2969 /ORGANISM="Oxyrrhis marina" /LENGTH=214 /DNA_ID=CAMNT_0051250917 /DNA_START=35 /DNA_END=679 /DNA_ORIENTATION=+
MASAGVLRPPRGLIPRPRPEGGARARSERAVACALASLDISQGAQAQLMRAAERGDVALVKQCLGCDLDVDSRTDDGWSALLLACQAGHLDVVQALLSAGANPRSELAPGWSAVQLASHQGHFEVAALLMAAGGRERTRGRLHLPLTHKVAGPQLGKEFPHLEDRRSAGRGMAAGPRRGGRAVASEQNAAVEEFGFELGELSVPRYRRPANLPA